MIIFQHCENWKTSGTMIKVESGTLILVEAGELIECMSYPELKMDIVQKIDNLSTGTYEVKIDEFRNYDELEKMLRLV